MQGAGTKEQRFRDSFRIKDASTILIRSLKNADITVSECHSEAVDGELSTPFPLDDAYIVGLQLREYGDCESWEEGQLASRTYVRAGETHFYDVKRNPRFLIDKPFHVLMFYVPRSAFDTIAEEARAPRMGELRYQPGIGYDDPVVRNLGGVMQEALKVPEQASRFFVDHVTLALTSHVAYVYGGLCQGTQPLRGGLAGWQKKRACELMDAHLDGGIALHWVAAECGLSISHFARAFRQSVGVTPHAWLMRRRVDAALSLMRDRQRPLSEIALMTGFADQSHFTRVFTKIVGVSPGGWRRNMAKPVEGQHG
ncbi:MAG TPA: AraC family transcriptional regulator [Rhodanobacteraceae bacterium]|jgi:AraC-like DNA-binding protein|nr:AraC family transcriptional regulator [Rhodanobacteraceae bacterium]